MLKLKKYHSWYLILVVGIAILFLIYLGIRIFGILQNGLLVREYLLVIITVIIALSCELSGLFLIKGLNKEKQSQNVIQKYYYSLTACFMFLAIVYSLDIPFIFELIAPGSLLYHAVRNVQRAMAWFAWVAMIYSIEVLGLLEFLRFIPKIPKGLLTVIALVLSPLVFLGIEIFLLSMGFFFIFGFLPSALYFFLSLQQRTDGETRIKSLFFSIGTLLIPGVTTMQRHVISRILPWFIPLSEFISAVPYEFLTYIFILSGFVLIGAFATSIDFGMEIQWEANLKTIMVLDTKNRKPLYTHQFSTTPGSKDFRLLAEGLKGISDLVQEITAVGSEVKVIQKEDLNIMIEQGQKFTIVLIVNVILDIYKTKSEILLRDLEKRTRVFEFSDENFPLLTQYALMLTDRHFKLQPRKERSRR